MKAKTTNVMAHLNNNGRVVVRLDPASGLKSMTITSVGDYYVVGRTPGDKLNKFTTNDVVAFLDANSIYINSWS